MSVRRLALSLKLLPSRIFIRRQIQKYTKQVEALVTEVPSVVAYRIGSRVDPQGDPFLTTFLQPHPPTGASVLVVGIDRVMELPNYAALERVSKTRPAAVVYCTEAQASVPVLSRAFKTDAQRKEAEELLRAEEALERRDPPIGKASLRG
eukprot:RCo010240